MNGTVAAVSREEEYRFSKRGRDAIRLLAGLGVEGDAHQGATVRHRSRMARDPAQPNLRQVHLLHRELFAEVAEAGFEVLPGQLGENITTAGIDLLALSTGTLLRLGDEAVVEVTGLRNPCAQIDGFRNGLLKEVLGRDERGRVVRRAGIMGIVLVGGEVRPGDRIMAEAPAGPHHPLEPV